MIRTARILAALATCCAVCLADIGEFDLGGPCLEGVTSPPSLYTKMREATEVEDWEQLIELHKQFVRGMCDNHFRWFGLADAYRVAGQNDLAIAALEEAHERGAELKEATLEHHPGLAELIQSERFAATALGRALSELRDVATDRRRGFRTQLKALEPGSRPPETWVAEGACPFECCTFREWGVVESTELYDKPVGSKVVGSIAVGTRVAALTGEVHLRPEAVGIVYAHEPFRAGEILFLLDYLGEGYTNYWRDGKVDQDEIWVAEVCLRPSRDCWAEYLEAVEERGQPVWWILVETADGLRGWTDRPQNFDNKDGCG